MEEAAGGSGFLGTCPRGALACKARPERHLRAICHTMVLIDGAARLLCLEELGFKYKRY